MSKGNQLFKDFVAEQKQLNEFEIRELDTTIDQILENPEKFGQDFVENNLSRSFKRILEAKKLGMDFAKRNLQIK
tara:strand:+ start:2982 stop:3206 length:225 start_codon:yes stop_codon:yes gene_type:complete